MSTARRHRDPAHARRIAGDIYGGMLRNQPELAGELSGVYARPVSPRGYLYQLAAGVGWTSLPFLPLLRQPALILAGDDDPIIPLVNAKIMAALLPSARLHVYPDGHLGLLTRALEIAPMIGSSCSATTSMTWMPLPRCKPGRLGGVVASARESDHWCHTVRWRNAVLGQNVNAGQLKLIVVRSRLACRHGCTASALPSRSPPRHPGPYCMVAAFMQLLHHERGIHALPAGAGFLSGCRTSGIRDPDKVDLPGRYRPDLWKT